MDSILKAEVFVNEDDNQLRAAHLILGYTPISRAFQAPKCVIKARDPHLHRISVAVEGFLLSEGASVPEGIPLVGSSSSRPVVEEGEEKTDEAEEIVEVGSSEDEFEVFNRAQSSKDPSGDLGDPSYTEEDFPSVENLFEADMGIQMRQSSSLLELIESQPGKGTQGKAVQSKTPPPSQSKLPLAPSKLPSPPPKSNISPRPQPSDPKHKRESKVKEVVEAERSRPTSEEDSQRAAKQQKVEHIGPEKRVDPLPEPQAWLLAPMLNGAPLMDNASIKDF